jgi:hypothetical protein
VIPKTLAVRPSPILPPNQDSILHIFIAYLNPIGRQSLADDALFTLPRIAFSQNDLAGTVWRAEARLAQWNTSAPLVHPCAHPSPLRAGRAGQCGVRRDGPRGQAPRRPESVPGAASWPAYFAVGPHPLPRSNPPSASFLQPETTQGTTTGSFSLSGSPAHCFLASVPWMSPSVCPQAGARADCTTLSRGPAAATALAEGPVQEQGQGQLGAQPDVRLPLPLLSALLLPPARLQY